MSQVRDKHTLDKVKDLIRHYYTCLRYAALIHLLMLLIYFGALYHYYVLVCAFVFKLAPLAGSELGLALLLSYFIFNNNFNFSII